MKSLFKLCHLLLLVQLFFISNMKCVEDSGSNYINSCENRNFLIISTVDGVVTALDINTGKKCWSVVLDEEKFLSSSLSEVEMFENGRRLWLVPSLDGGLYKYDNLRKVIQPLPVDVDSLISHSMYFDPSTSIIGGKVKVLYGISRLTGEIIYVCKMEGCKNFKSPFPQNMLIIEEITQYVNAIDSIKAEKKWHFRVSELIVKLTSPTPSDNTSAFENGTQKNALIPRNYQEFVNVDAYKISLQNGFAGMLNKTSQDFAWSFKASCPITDAWYVKDNIVKILDPFDKESGFFSVDMDDGHHSALLFLGVFENQLFIKKSKNFPLKDSNLNSLATNILYHSYVIPVCPKSENHVALSSTFSTEDLMKPSWDLNATDYGSYFYINYSIAENGTHCIINTSYIVQYQESVKINYQVLAIYITTSIVTCIIFLMVFPSLVRKALNKEIASLIIPTKFLDGIPVDKEFRSRFHQDFEFVSTLGRGGFGVVMEVKNKIDDWRYAVKRIRLHEQLNNAQYERVLREVKALAKLDHHGIVRYFNAWTEYPPDGWQESVDKQFNIRDCSESYEGYTSNDLSHKSSRHVDTTSICPDSSLRCPPLLLRCPHPSLVYPDSSSKSEQQKISESLKMKLNQNPLNFLDDDLLNFDSTLNEFSTSGNLDENSASSSDSQVQTSEVEKSSSDEESGIYASRYNYDWYQDYDKSGSSVVFETSERNVPHEDDVFSEEADLKSLFEPVSHKSASKEDSSLQVESSLKHDKCFSMLRCLNEKLVYKLNLEIFNVLRSYFFHDESSTGLSVTERSDWKKTINEGTIVDKISFQQWLISILCLIQSSDESMCSLLIMNLCHILCDVNKSLNDIHNIKNGLIVPDRRPQRKRAVQFSKESSLSSALELFGLVLPCKSKAGMKSTKEVPRGYLYIQMQLCQKESLRDWLDHNCDQRDYVKVMEIFSQIVDAVHYVHSCGLMHRDLKPSNIYFSLEGAIKIGDFGLATSSEIHEAAVTNTVQSFAHTSDIGTEIYMSPEQKLKRNYDYKTDIYSLGIILFELLVPFKTASERYKVLPLVRRHKFPEDFAAKYAKESELVRTLLNDDPASRPTTVEIKENLFYIHMQKGESLNSLQLKNISVLS